MHSEETRGDGDALLHAVDTQSLSALRDLAASGCAVGQRERDACFAVAVAHGGAEVLRFLLASPFRPSTSQLHSTFGALVAEGLRPTTISCLQEHIAPIVIAEHRRSYQTVKKYGSVEEKGMYLVDDLEMDALRLLERRVESALAGERAVGSPSSRNRARELALRLQQSAWVNELLIDAAQGSRKLLLHRLLRLPRALRPSQNAVNTAFRKAIEKDLHSVAAMLAARGDHAAVAAFGWSCVDQNGYDEAFEKAVDMIDCEGVSFLLNGRLGFRPAQGLIDLAFRDHEVTEYAKSFVRESRRPPFGRGGGATDDKAEDRQRTEFIAQLLGVNASSECHNEVFAEKQQIRRRHQVRNAQEALFRQGGGVDIHDYSGSVVARPAASPGVTAPAPDPEPGARRHRSRRRENTLNEIVLDHIESRVAAEGGRHMDYDLNAMIAELTGLIMRTFSTDSEQNSAVDIIGAVLNEESLQIFSRTLTFLRLLSRNSDQREDILLNVWMQGFLSESIVMHSCNPGALERVVTGLRGIGDPQLDALFGQAEGPHLASAFLKGTMNIFAAANPAEQERSARNARNLADALVSSYGVTLDTTESDLLPAIIRYASESVQAYGVNVAERNADITAISEMITDNYETHLRRYIVERINGDEDSKTSTT